jgi:hypothetical protein
MNILNYEAQSVENLAEMIEKQKEIMFAFEPELKQRVEEFDIDIYEDQMLLKDFLLVRAVEEITEAGAAIKANHVEHYKEEIIDVFNFLVETAIILNYPIDTPMFPEDTKADPVVAYLKEGDYVQKYVHSLDNDYDDETNRKYRVQSMQCELYNLIQDIGELTNVLKLRPWRQSQYPVDLMTFKQRWVEVWHQFWLMLRWQGFGFEEFKEVWSKKYQVNKFRIDSNY